MDRRMDKITDTYINGWTNGQIYRERHGQRDMIQIHDRQMDRGIDMDKPMDSGTDTYSKMYGQKDSYIDKWMDGWTDRR